MNYFLVLEFVVRDSAVGGVALENGNLVIHPAAPRRVGLGALRDSIDGDDAARAA